MAGALLWLSVNWWLSVSDKYHYHASLIGAFWLVLLYSFVTTQSGFVDGPSAMYFAVQMGIQIFATVTLQGISDYGWPNSALLLVLAFLLRESKKGGFFWLFVVIFYFWVMKFMGFDLLDFVHFLVEWWS